MAIIVEDNGMGGKKYYSDSLGHSVFLFDTSISKPSEILEALSIELSVGLYDLDSTTPSKEAFLLGALLAYRSENQQLLKGKLPESIIRRYDDELIELLGKLK